MNHLVKKSNALIEGRHQVLDLVELRMIALVAAQINVNDEDFKPYRLKVSELYHDSRNAGVELKARVKSVMGRVVEVKEEDGWSMYQIFCRARYYKGLGEIELKFHPDIKHLFLQLKERFTVYELRYAMQIPSTYSFRLYELFMQYKNTADKRGRWARTIELPELHRMLDINEKTASSYLNFGKLKQGILEPAKRHMSQFTDIDMEYTPLKISSRSYTHIEFKLSYKHKGDILGPLTKQEQAQKEKCSREVGGRCMPIRNAKGVEYKELSEWLTKYERSKICAHCILEYKAQPPELFAGVSDE